MDESKIDEFAPAVIDAEAELVNDLPELVFPVAPEESNEVSEAASHAETIIAAAPAPVAEVEALAQVEAATRETVPEAPRTNSLTEALDDEREQAIEEERTQAAEQAILEYGTLRNEELELVGQAEHEQWSKDRLDDAMGALKQEA